MPVRVLSIPNGTLREVHQLLKMGGDVVRPELVDADVLSDLVRLSTVFYVDGGTTAPLALRDGSIARPFGTVQAGVDALAALGPGVGGTLLIVPRTYAETVGVAANCPVNFVGLAGVGVGNSPHISAVISSSSIRGFGLFIQAVSVAGSIRFVNVGSLSISASLDSSYENVATNALSGLGSSNVFLRNCTVGTSASCFNLEAWDSSIAALTVSGTLTARYCSVSGIATAVGATNLYKCRLLNSLAVTGALTSDYDSIASILASVSSGSFALVEQVPKITVSVVVPAVAAGAVGYANVTLVGTDLEGFVPVGSLLAANPTADLVAAGAGGGYLNCRLSAANTVRFAFVGPLAGGASDFILGVL